MDEFHDVRGDAWVSCTSYDVACGSAIIEQFISVALHHTNSGCYLISTERDLEQGWLPTAYC